MGHHIEGCARAASYLAAFALCAVMGFARAANPGCLDTDPVPSAPLAGATYVFFDADQYPDDRVRIEVWRLSCSPQPSRLIVRMTPRAGLPNACGLDFTVFQGGEGHFNLALKRDPASSIPFCDRLFSPTSFLLTDCGCTAFDVDRGFSLVYSPYANPVSYAVSVAAAGNKPDPIVPARGLWWNPDESGTGYTIDVQHGVLAMAIYSYQPGGTQEWYYVTGPLTNDGHTFTGTLDKYRGGQCISCAAYAGRPTLIGNDGIVTINFSSSVAATVTLPGGRVTNIQPLLF